MCPNCGGQCIMGADLGLDEHQVRIENARLREEVYLLPLFQLKLLSLRITFNKYLIKFSLCCTKLS